MANVLDLRRRIRSVKNTRQITKAMKMVSAAKLRRAQERAMLARPYARMISNVLESLVRRTDIYDDEPATSCIRCWSSAKRRTFSSSSSPATRASPAPSTPTSSRPRRLSSTPAARRDRTSTSSPSAARRATLFRKRYPPPSTRRRKSTTTTISPRTTRSSVTAPSRSKSPAIIPRSCSRSTSTKSATWRADIIERYTRSRDRLRLPRLQRVQVRHLAARRRRKASPHPQARLA